MIDTAENPSSCVPCDARRILIVDDESAIRKVFNLVVSAGLPNCRIDAAINGAEAVEFFREAHHGIILMDLHMPVMNGEQAFIEIRRLCEQQNWEMPSVVFCTGFDPPDGVRKLVAHDSKHCLLRKPVTNKVLVEAIKARLPA